MDEMKISANHVFDKRHAVLLMDEMKISANHVFDKVPGDLIGFLDLGNPGISFASLEEALVFLLRGICTEQKFSLADFGTKGISRGQMMPVLWKAV